jgi:hypothetical protein
MSPQQFKLTSRVMETEKLVEAAKAKMEAAIFTGNNAKINEAQLEAVEAYREHLDAITRNTYFAIQQVRRGTP